MNKPRKSGGQATAAARQRARAARLADMGLKRVPVIVPVEREDEIKAIAATMCKPAH
jgi:hypothetical protein